MGEWTKASQKKKRNKGYVPPDWVKDVEKTADEMSTSDFFQKVIESLTSKLANFAKDQITMVILGLGQPSVTGTNVSILNITCSNTAVTPNKESPDKAIVALFVPKSDDKWAKNG